MLHLNSSLEIPCTASECSGWKWHTARCWGRLCRDDRRERGTELFMQLQSQLCQPKLFACPANVQSTHASGRQMVVAQRKVTIVLFAEWCQDSLEHFFSLAWWSFFIMEVQSPWRAQKANAMWQKYSFKTQKISQNISTEIQACELCHFAHCDLLQSYLLQGASQAFPLARQYNEWSQNFPCSA